MPFKSLLVFLFIGVICFSQSKNSADIGNDEYKNPIISGRYANPSVVKVGDDYYMVHSMAELIWHSKDLVNWQPVGYATENHFEKSYAPELTYYNGKFYIYTTFLKYDEKNNRYFENVVITANKPEGPWSKPINLNIPGKIDPGHLATSDGKRFLYFNKGYAIELDSSGTKTIGELQKVYDGWDYPDEWIVECFCLESPKFFKRGNYYYMVSAQGGTAGPATSHMAIVARSKSPLGPWENSPYNPLIKTYSKSEKWWSQGHATLIKGPNKNWYAIFHAYENGYRPLGRQTLLLPISWSEDGWPINENLNNAEGLYKKPKNLEQINHGMSLSDNFSTDQLAIQWRSYSKGKTEDFFKNGHAKLKIKAQGQQLLDGSKLGFLPTNHSYEVTVKVSTTNNSAIGGIALMPSAFNVENISVNGIGLANNQVIYHQNGKEKEHNTLSTKSIYLKIRNIRNDLNLFYSTDEKEWEKTGMGIDISGIKSIVVILYAYGNGEVTFENLKYTSIN